MKRTKIICTLGPASESATVIRGLLRAGMNAARINCSHGTHEEYREKIKTFREVRDELGLSASLLLDTKGPEIRLGDFENGSAVLKANEHFSLVTYEVLGTEESAKISYKGLPRDVKQGDHILIDDGKVALIVEAVTDDEIKCRVSVGGKISNHKGINVPSVNVNMEYISDMDKADLLFGIEHDVDYVAASFVRSAEDVRNLRTFLNENGGQQIKIIAKIENKSGLLNFDEILKESDGIMIARGDMGVEIAYERLPGIQKSIIKKCLQSGKLAITATQMLESMIDNKTPTRAEITDVANAVFDGTGAIMLSGETAIGKYPVEVVKTMSKIAVRAESEVPKYHSHSDIWHEMISTDITNAVGHSACTLAKDIKAGAIIAITKTGYTARRISKFRPGMRIIGISPYEKTFHQLALEWGVIPMRVGHRNDLETLMTDCMEKVVERGHLRVGHKVVMTAGMPLNVPGNTNIIRVETV